MPLTPLEWLKSVERKLKRTAKEHSGAALGAGVHVTTKPSKDEDSSSILGRPWTSPPPTWLGSTNSTACRRPPR
uniref:Uncharacterized protein n=1 Tax=Tanacetum cinerariifolium TaxID=118510 RepID=A0A699XSY8_TANCI|nr:hypothetical protein [Tanacetum cinerariifolium]